MRLASTRETARLWCILEQMPGFRANGRAVEHSPSHQRAAAPAVLARLITQQDASPRFSCPAGTPICCRHASSPRLRAGTPGARQVRAAPGAYMRAETRFWRVSARE
ncbi:hypothetical protein EVG20_g8906 [Dentipellis fragilis]|uniref:Uncharacterized protein n=1 Tax=Dentipellis fragilis TaxID=205917 RepID=A0A4Y9Y319_9AGAM|nr:hypothetical protein EVG20_g8906 [Dentipellis fragilis]